MSYLYMRNFVTEIFRDNKMCTFYVVRCLNTNKYHVFVVVYPCAKIYDKKGYVVSTHDNEEMALEYKNKFVKMLTFANNI